MNAKMLATVILSTLVETLEEVPEGHLYAACMERTDIGTFMRAISALAETGFIERHMGPTVRATAKARVLPWPAQIKVLQEVAP